MIVHSPMWQGSVHNSCPQETFNDPINSMLRRCVALGVDTTWFSDTVKFIVAFYGGQPEARQ